ncbi:MAG: hypothetical protein JWP96_2605 [Polaromonas sp.]|nr:hypothetical protein [Polaromonas sp.]
MLGILAITGPIYLTIALSLSLFVIGGALVGLKIQGLRRQVMAISAGKLLIYWF